VKYFRNDYLNWDYNLTKKSFNSEGVGLEMSLFCVEFMWNDPFFKFAVVAEHFSWVTSKKRFNISVLCVYVTIL
jgi:hypothetical protein